MKKEKKNSLVIKSNQMIEASYKLSLQEQRIILYMASMIQPDDEDFKPVKISIKEFASLMGTQNTNHTYMQQTTRDLLSRVITIKEEKSILQVGWLSSARYFNQEGFVELRFDPNLKPYLLQLKERFTKYAFSYVIRLRHSYSIRFYELLKQYESIGSRNFILNDLKEILGIGEGEYKLYAHFKDRVLKPVKKEFDLKYNKHELDFTFEYEEQKDGRKVISLKFKILKPHIQMELFERETDEGDHDLSLDAIEAELKTLGLTKKQIASLLKKAAPEVIRSNIGYVQRKASNSGVRNTAAYLLDAIAGNYASTQINEYDPHLDIYKKKASVCWSNCKGGCAAIWENHKDNKLSDCHYCKKFDEQRARA